jgi:molecular chaperone GrpE
VSEKDNGGDGGSDLDRAMADAVRSMEQREGSDPGRKRAEDGSDEGEAEKPRAAGEAITESLLKAKNELQEVLKQTQTEAQSLRDKWLRAAADLDNYRKRAAKEREDVVKFGNERLLKDFLPVIDDLDRVVASAKNTNDPVVEGVRLVLKKFLDQVEKHGVGSFDTEGKAFDPNLHEAVQQVASEKPMGTVVNQLQRGYTLGGRLLRPALVTVSMGPSSEKQSS